MRELTIAGRRISDDDPCYVISELGHNHGGSIETAVAMIKAAAQCGADSVKLQKRHNATLYSEAMRALPYVNENSFGATYGAHRDALEFNEAQYQRCLSRAAAYGVSCFATAFDEASADFLMRLKVPAIKIASGGLTDGPLLKHVASLGVPIILSTGGGDQHDIYKAANILGAKTNDFALLHCTAAYPTRDFKELNLRCILTLRDRYPETVIGWSGHDSGIAMALIAYAFGARIVEKHFTMNRASKGTDHAWSLEPAGLRKLRRDLDRARDAMGDGIKQFYPSEYGPISKMRRSYLKGAWQIATQAELGIHA